MTILVTWRELLDSEYVQDFIDKRQYNITSSNTPNDNDEFIISVEEAFDWGFIKVD